MADAGVCAGPGVAGVAALWGLQRRWSTSPPRRCRARRRRTPGAEPVTLQTGDGLALGAWSCRPRAAGSRGPPSWSATAMPATGPTARCSPPGWRGGDGVLLFRLPRVRREPWLPSEAGCCRRARRARRGRAARFDADRIVYSASPWGGGRHRAGVEDRLRARAALAVRLARGGRRAPPAGPPGSSATATPSPSRSAAWADPSWSWPVRPTPRCPGSRAAGSPRPRAPAWSPGARATTTAFLDGDAFLDEVAGFIAAALDDR